MAQATNERALRMKYQGEQTFLLDAPQSIKLASVREGDIATFFMDADSGLTTIVVTELLVRATLANFSKTELLQRSDGFVRFEDG